jgi:hypothetical protein
MSQGMLSASRSILHPTDVNTEQTPQRITVLVRDILISSLCCEVRLAQTVCASCSQRFECRTSFAQPRKQR